MSTGRVCEKHQEWCPNGECRWCEPAQPDLDIPFQPIHVPVLLTYPEWKQRASVVTIRQAELDAAGHMTLEQLLKQARADEAKALRAMRLRLAEALAMSAKDAEESPDLPSGYCGIDADVSRFWRSELARSGPMSAAELKDAMNRMWVKLNEREQPPQPTFEEGLNVYGMKDSE